MTLLNVRKLGTALAAVALALVFTAAAQAQAGRSTWVYAGGAGSFAQANSPGQWVERTHLGTVYTFTEVRRAPHFVELYDASRNLSVRLYDDDCLIRHAGTGGRFIFLYSGYWSR